MSIKIFRFLAGTALVLSASPALADTPATPSYAVAAPAPGSVDALISQYVASRGYAPLFLAPAQAATAAVQLSAILRAAPLDGFAAGPGLADQIDAAVASARGGNVAAVRSAEQVMASAWVRYVQKLESPTAGMMYGDPRRRPTISRPERILALAAAAPSLADHLRSASQVNPVYAALRDTAVADPSAATMTSKVAANLERLRSLPQRGRFVLVDAAAARLYMYENGRAVDSMKVIVGMKELPTPMIASTIFYTTYNPYWHVPDHLNRKIIAPKVIKGGMSYLKSHGYEVVADWSDAAQVIDPTTIDWKAVSDGSAIIKVRQLPGPGNSMGKLKFAFDNSEGIYLHDTPQKDLFAKTSRTISNGCIRLEDARRLGRWLAGAEPKAPSAVPEQYVALPGGGVPVYVTYLTAQSVGGKLTFIDDVYNRDGTAQVATIN